MCMCMSRVILLLFISLLIMFHASVVYRPVALLLYFIRMSKYSYNKKKFIFTAHTRKSKKRNTIQSLLQLSRFRILLVFVTKFTVAGSSKSIWHICWTISQKDEFVKKNKTENMVETENSNSHH